MKHGRTAVVIGMTWLICAVPPLQPILLVHPSSSRWYIGVFQSRAAAGRGGYICSARIGLINSAGCG